MPTDNKIRAMALEERAGKSSDEDEDLELSPPQWSNSHQGSLGGASSDDNDFITTEELMEDEFRDEETEKHNKWSNFFGKGNNLENEAKIATYADTTKTAAMQPSPHGNRRLNLFLAITTSICLVFGFIISAKLLLLDNINSPTGTAATARAAILMTQAQHYRNDDNAANNNQHKHHVAPRQEHDDESVTFYDLVRLCRNKDTFDANLLLNRILVDKRAQVMIYLDEILTGMSGGDDDFDIITGQHTVDSCAPENLGFLSLAMDPYMRQFGNTMLLNRFVLANLYASTGGTDWYENNQWFTESDECSWHGVVCVGPVISELLLSSNNLRGSLPDALYALTDLTVIEMQGNEITGSLSPKIGKLKKLATLFLNQNDMKGSLPTSIGQLCNLAVLNLQSNRFTGHLPEQLGNLNPKRMRSIGIGSNQFEGTVPKTIFNLSNLGLLEMGHLGNVIGMIPTTIGNMTLLEQLDATEVVLSGSIPSEVGLCKSLKVLNVPKNRLKGRVPSELGQLHALEYVDLRSNLLEMPFVEEVCDIGDDLGELFHPGKAACTFSVQSF